MTKIRHLKDLETLKEKGLKSLYPETPKMTISMATCGLATGARRIYETVKQEVEKQHLDWMIAETGCLGFCQKEPLLYFFQPGKPKLFYGELTEDKAAELITALANGEIKKDWVLWKMEGEEYIIRGTRHLLGKGEDGFKDVPTYSDIPFFAKQLKIALRNCGFIDPNIIEEYIERGGYFSLYKVLTDMKPEEVIDEVKQSGLRGRGGAGFPTGRKWEFCQMAKGTPKYIICNADEGDPGAYMDRSILEGDPHSVLEGMAIGAYAMGAEEGYIYVRMEYPLAIERLEKAIQQAEDCGLLGENIFNSGFNFNIKIVRGAGAFVCGEETAMIASIEGRPVEPRLRPPYPAQSGLWGKPTNINNVETWANVPVIIARGGEWYASIGSEKSKGTKVFSLVGKINNTGLVEVPMGIPLREIIYDIGGGILVRKKFKAVQTGGPSGGCVPESLIDLPVDYERLTEAGSIMGSGGMIVIDEDTCVVDLAKFFIDFTRHESCGKCNSCREGLDALFEVLSRIADGKGEVGDIDFMEDLSNAIIDFSMCALGGTAPNPVLTTIRYFRDEYEAHIKDRRCPALVCKELISYYIDPEKCTACMLCLKNCPVDAIDGEKRKIHVIDQSKCTKCGTCYDVCPPKIGAVRKISGKPVPPPWEEERVIQRRKEKEGG